MSGKKVYGIVIDDYSAPSGCSGTDMLFGTVADIDDTMAAYREHRIQSLERERDEASQSLVKAYIERSNAWDGYYRKTGKPIRCHLEYDDDCELPRRLIPEAIELEVGDDGKPDTSQIDSRMLRSAEVLAQKLFAIDNDMHTYDGSWRRFKAGQEDVQVGAAYSLQRFVHEADVKESLSFEIPASEGQEVSNIWGWPYTLKWESARVEMLWLTAPNRLAAGQRRSEMSYERVCKLEFEHFAMKGSFGDEFSAPWSHWGMPGLLEQVNDPSVIKKMSWRDQEEEREEIPSCWIRTRLYLPDRAFSTEGEMFSDWELAKAAGKADVNLAPLCLAIVGDG